MTICCADDELLFPIVGFAYDTLFRPSTRCNQSWSSSIVLGDVDVGYGVRLFDKDRHTSAPLGIFGVKESWMPKVCKEVEYDVGLRSPLPVGSYVAMM